MSNIKDLAIMARDSARLMAVLDTATKNKALSYISKALVDNKEAIFAANDIDLVEAEKDGLDMPLFKRLKFKDEKIKDVTDGIDSLIGLEDPSGKITLHTILDDGLDLYRVTCPIGVIGIIFESRPDALVQIASLCVKSGNAVFLKGGREALNTNKVLSDVIYKAGVEAGLPEGWLHLLESREDVSAMLELNEYIDLIIPRGSNSFVQYIMQNTSIPVMGHADGVCHVYIDDDCDEDLALKVAIDSKTQYVSVCNTTETILVNRGLKDTLLPKLVESLKAKGVEIFFEEDVTEWHHEYLDYKVSLKLVDDVDEAINHINKYSSGHTDCIITKDATKAEKFMNAVDSGNVMHNCSTRFSDGFRYGFGAEVGISTSKLHARGPVGLEGLVTYKYKVYGHGNIVDDYASSRKTFKHIKCDI